MSRMTAGAVGEHQARTAAQDAWGLRDGKVQGAPG